MTPEFTVDRQEVSGADGRGGFTIGNVWLHEQLDKNYRPDDLARPNATRATPFVPVGDLQRIFFLSRCFMVSIMRIISTRKIPFGSSELG